MLFTAPHPVIDIIRDKERVLASIANRPLIQVHENVMSLTAQVDTKISGILTSTLSPEMKTQLESVVSRPSANLSSLQVN